MKKIMFIMICVFSIIHATNGGKKIKLKAGTSPGYPPFEYMENDKLVGFEIELLEAIAEEIGVTIEWNILNFDGIIASLATKKIDVAAGGLGITEERKRVVDFTTPIYGSKNNFLKLKSSGSIKSRADLANKKLAYQVSALQELTAKDIKAEVKETILVGQEDVILIVLSLLSKKVDVGIIVSAVANEYLAKYPDLEVAFEEPVIGTSGMSMALTKNSPYTAKFNEAIETLKKDGRYEKLLKKYKLN